MKMAPKFKLSFLLALPLSLSSVSLLAQEENFSSQELQELKLQQHQELNLEDDKTLIMEVDGKPSKSMPSSSSNKETGSSTAAKAKPEANKAAAKDKTEDDALNFNFLYFIIQRFKISDIVDD